MRPLYSIIRKKTLINNEKVVTDYYQKITNSKNVSNILTRIKISRYYTYI